MLVTDLVIYFFGLKLVISSVLVLSAGMLRDTSSVFSGEFFRLSGEGSLIN